MNGLKRKHTGEQSSGQSRLMKKVQDHAEAALVAQAMGVFDDVDDHSDEYEPDHAEEDGKGGEDGEELASTPHPRRIATPGSSLVSKQKLLDDQVMFIIQSRDNNLPDPYGERSTATGPMTWPDVAKAYNEKFGYAIGGPAMEKRARLHRARFMAAHPDYPRQILYAEKTRPAVPRGARERKTKQLAQFVGVDRPQMTAAQKNEDVIDFGNEAHPTNTSFRVGGWVPPDDVRNAAGLNTYIHYRTPVPPHEQWEWMEIEVEGTDGQPLGDVHVRVQDIRRSSRWAASELEYSNELKLKLTCPSRIAATRYVQLISMQQLSKLPDWDIASLIEIYGIAAQMEDQCVKDLILQRWQESAQQDIEVKLDLDDLNNIFFSTEPQDPARDLWVKIVFAAGVGIDVAEWNDCHTTLKTQLQEMLAGKKCHSPLHS